MHNQIEWLQTLFHISLIYGQYGFILCLAIKPHSLLSQINTIYLNGKIHAGIKLTELKKNLGQGLNRSFSHRIVSILYNEVGKLFTFSKERRAFRNANAWSVFQTQTAVKLRRNSSASPQTSMLKLWDHERGKRWHNAIWHAQLLHRLHMFHVSSSQTSGAGLFSLWLSHFWQSVSGSLCADGKCSLYGGEFRPWLHATLG